MDQLQESRMSFNKNAKRLLRWGAVAFLVIFVGLFFLANRPPRHPPANKSKAKAAIGDLTSAISAFVDEQERLPLASKFTQDTEVITDDHLMNVLCGIDEAENPNQIPYFTYREAKGKNDNYWDGLYRTRSTANLFGPWKNETIENRNYHVFFDYDGDRKIRLPAELGGEVISDVQFLIYHKGKDGKIGGDFNIDNIYSWK